MHVSRGAPAGPIAGEEAERERERERESREIGELLDERKGRRVYRWSAAGQLR